MTEPRRRAARKTAGPPAGPRNACRPSEQFDQHLMRGALYSPPQPGLPYLAIILNAEDEVLAARSVPSAEAGKNLVAKVDAAFASARSCKGKEK